MRKRFKESKHKNTDLEVLKAAIRAQLEKLIRLNRTRADFAEKFEELIESYNAGSRNIEELFEELLKLSRSLNEEQQRHVRENMTEEELVIFDILTRPAPELSAEERAEVKKVARELLARLKSCWCSTGGRRRRRVRDQARHRGRARLRAAARLHAGAVPAEVLGGLRACLRELSRAKCGRLFPGCVTSNEFGKWTVPN